MNIIISHDVDHLMNREHRFKDLILEKLVVRSGIQLLQRKISFNTLLNRIGFVFTKRFNRIPEIIEFDTQHHIPSTFFFGMNQGLGMNYQPEDTTPWVNMVKDKGFDYGVHTIEIHDLSIIRKEHNTFKSLSETDSFGTRIHYVRYDDDTFSKLAKAGYSFDTSEFDKEEKSLKQPYKISGMWEFPLHIMEGYILREGFEKAKAKTLSLLDEAEKTGCKYVTFLFHDPYFDQKLNPTEYNYYLWFVDECERRGYTFVSYNNAIKELNEREH